MIRFTFFIVLAMQSMHVLGQHSVARRWNEVMLDAIRNDFARPTVHARNLFHISAAMYDAWAAYDTRATPYFLGKVKGDTYIPYSPISIPEDPLAAQEEAISYAAYRLLSYRFAKSPGVQKSQQRFDQLMNELGYSTTYTSSDYSNENPAALGNYIAEIVINYGSHDYSNESNEYENNYYESVNPPLLPALPGNPDLKDPNRWQPLTLDFYVDQSGNIISNNSPPFLSPEWGNVVSFCLGNSDLTTYSRNDHDYKVYLDPGPPPYLDMEKGGEMSELYKWNFSLVSVWSAHLDPSDGVMWDISPASLGNLQGIPENQTQYPDFYDLIKGGDPSMGYELNPVTGEPYEAQVVPRGDYTRVLAEFWADGPDSETPPGHWFTILNYVSDHPLLEKKFKGEGADLSPLEWDIKSYFTLGCAMHDAAVTAWGIKGWYDYIRPISAIRFLADQGQSSDPNLPSYNKNGIPLQEGYIELVKPGDPLAGSNNKNVDKIKVRAWRGPDYIENPATDAAGVGWILGENWWPYQRPTFVTPPFAGYISGHSTFSRTAAEILTLFTGSPFFPGGMGEFVAKKDEFLVFEKGPSVDVVLQWATYRDASDQCSLSRIWGGIHPPADDLKGRLIGKKIGEDAFELAEKYFSGYIVSATSTTAVRPVVYPNPVHRNELLMVKLASDSQPVQMRLYDLAGNLVLERAENSGGRQVRINLHSLKSGIYILTILKGEEQYSEKIKIN